MTERPRFLIAPDAGTRLEGIRSWLLDRAPGEEALLLAPTPDAGRELLRELALERGALFGVARAVLPRLASSLVESATGERPVPVGSLVAEAVVARVAQSLAAKGSLRRYAVVAGGPGFPRAAASVLHELRLALADPRTVEREDPELTRLLLRYGEELQETGLADRAGLYTAAADLARDPAFRHPWLDLPTAVLDLPLANPAEAVLVAAVLARAPQAVGTVPSGDAETIRHLEPFAELETAAAPANGTPLDRLQRHLFEETSPPETPDGAEVLVLSAPGENREAVEVARRVMAAARDGVPFDRMAVFLRSPEEYRPHLREAFRRAGVPVHFARGTVRPDPSGRAFLALLACASERLSARRFAEYLSLGEVPPAGREVPDDPEGWVAPDEESLPEAIADTGEEPPEEETPAVRAPRRWEKLLVEAAVIGGLDRWKRRLDGLTERLTNEIEELDDPDDPMADRKRRMLDDLASLRSYALPLLEVLDGYADRVATWGEWLATLRALAVRSLGKPDRVLSVLNELSPMGDVGPVRLDEVRIVLSRRLLEIADRPRASRYGRIFVGPAEAARGLAFDVVFVPALAERLFPRKIAEEPFLLDATRERTGLDLTRNPDRVAAERLALRLAVGAARKRVVLSYPRLDLELGRPRVPSFYALEALRAASGALPDFDELAARAETVTQARVGWPAPRNVADAIDEAEHDLAILRELLVDPENAVGAARYLLSANPHLTRALRGRPRRWLRKWTFADGLVDVTSEAAKEAIHAHGLDRRSFSPTALQHFAYCPYRFFLYAVHRLEPREEPEPIEEIDPLSRGSMVHEVQFRLYRQLSDEGMLPVRPGNLRKAQRYLEKHLGDVAQEFEDDLAPAIDRVWRDGISSILADLRKWLLLASEDDSGYVPWRFELAFGLPGKHGRDPHSMPDPASLDCGIRLRGSIDLVEKDAGGTIRVTDYKTGKERMKKDEVVSGGQILQPVLYALAMEKLEPGAKVASGQLYYCTEAGGFHERPVPLDREARASADLLARVVGEALTEPFLPAAPAERACTWCDYRTVCGTQEEFRTRRKPQKKLKSLLELRERR